jgi:hypothetical protein
MKKNKRLWILIFCLQFIYLGCQYEIAQPMPDFFLIQKDYSLKVSSEDPILLELVCVRLHSQGFLPDCGNKIILPEIPKEQMKKYIDPFQEPEDIDKNLDEEPVSQKMNIQYMTLLQNPHRGLRLPAGLMVRYASLLTSRTSLKSVSPLLLTTSEIEEDMPLYRQPYNQKEEYLLEIRAKVKEPASDYWLNISASIITLTTGVFMSTSATAQYYANLKYSDKVLYDSHLDSVGRVGYWAILPFYVGLVGTNIAALLNTYRSPENLQRYCLYSKDPKDVQTKEEYCKEYKVFLEDSFYQIEKKLINMLRTNIISAGYYD